MENHFCFHLSQYICPLQMCVLKARVWNLNEYLHIDEAVSSGNVLPDAKPVLPSQAARGKPMKQNEACSCL